MTNSIKEFDSEVAKVLSAHLPSDKLEFYYEYANKVLAHEFARYHKLDDKAGRYITSVSAAFTILAGTFSWGIDAILYASLAIKYVFLTLSCIGFIGLIVAWSFLFGSMKIQKTPQMPLDEAVQDRVITVESSDLYLELTGLIKQVNEAQFSISEKKATLIGISYNWIALSAGSFVLAAFILLLSKIY